MKRIVLNAYEKALVLKRGKLVNVLDAGTYWTWLNYEVIKCDITKPFYYIHDLSTIENNPLLNGKMTVVKVEEGMIGLEYRDGLYRRVLDPGKYAYWKGPINYTVKLYDTNELMVSEDFPKRLMQKPEIANRIRVYQVAQNEIGLLTVDGKYEGTLNPGMYIYWRNEKAVLISNVDLRNQTLEVAGQEILTRDKAAVRVNFQARYKVVDPVKAMIETQGVTKQMYVALQLVIRAYMGSLTLDQVLSSKEEIGPYVLKNCSEQIRELGVELLGGGIKDIILPGDMKDIMNQVLVAQKKAQANTIMRQEETASTRSLLNTAKLMEQNDMLYKLKEMEYIEKIADKIGEITVSGGDKVLNQLRTIVTGGT